MYKVHVFSILSAIIFEKIPFMKFVASSITLVICIFLLPLIKQIYSFELPDYAAPGLPIIFKEGHSKSMNMFDIYL